MHRRRGAIVSAPAVGMPLVDQYLLRVLPIATERAGGAPYGSAAFRAALRDISETTGLMPTRTETAAAVRRLAARGLIGDRRR